MDRAELAAFLRSRRERLGPGDVGLPAAARRRTRGLRREEVALLAGMSVDYYARLEQARGPSPSRQVLAALARALRLTDDERDHLFRLSGEPAPEPQTHADHLRPGLLYLLDRLAGSAVMVVNDLGDVLAWTPLAQALWNDPGDLPAGQRNLYRSFFTGPQEQRLLPEDHERAAGAHVADLRAAWARRRGDPAARRLVEDLRRASPLFERLWATHDVAVRRVDRKRILHPTVGLLELDCEVLLTPAHDQRLIVYTAPPGSETADKLELLGVVGLQRLAPETTPDGRQPTRGPAVD